MATRFTSYEPVIVFPSTSMLISFVILSAASFNGGPVVFVPN